MELVLVDGAPKLDNGKPVYLDSDGVERTIDVAKLHADLKTTAEQRDRFQSEKKAALGQLNKYKTDDGYLDPEAAREAIALKSTLNGTDVSELQGQVASLTAERDQLKVSAGELSETNKSLGGELDNLTIGAEVRSSEWAKANLLPAFTEHPERLLHEYGGHFARGEDGKVLAYTESSGDNRAPLYSRKNPSQLATVDEALEILVTDKTLFKAGNAGGGGSDPDTPTGTPPPGSKKWEEMTPAEKVAVTKAGG